MDENGFRQSLKRSGKKEHVVEGLVRQAQAYERWLIEAGFTGLQAAGENELRDYAQTLDPGVMKERMRGTALYYQYLGKPSLAKLASDFRRQEIDRTSRAFKLSDFRGVASQEIARLEAAGIVTVEEMRAAGKTPEARRQLAERAGVSPLVILELVKLSDLARLSGVKGIRARLYYDAGLDTLEKFSQWEPEKLRDYLVEWVERTGFEGAAPLPKEIRGTIAAAAKLPKIVEYESA